MLIAPMPLLWLSLSFLCGIWLASLLTLPGWVWLVSALPCLALAYGEVRLRGKVGVFERWRRVSPLPLGLLLAMLMGGAARYQVHKPAWDAQDLAFFNGTQEVEVLGRIDAPPDVRERSVLLRIASLKLALPAAQDSLEVRGDLLAVMPAGGDWQYGDRILLKGRLDAPPEAEDFSYRAYLAGRGIYSTMSYPYVRLMAHDTGNPLLSAIYHLRQRAYRNLNQMLPQPEAALLSGILLGMENDIPTDLERAYQDTGTAHIIAISGFNIAVLAGLFSALTLRLVPRLWSPLVVALGIALYTILVGAQASVVRAAIMGSLALFGRQIGRSSGGANSLAFCAALMCLFNPLLPWDVSFQLSFMATLGLVLFAEPLSVRAEAWAAKRFSPGLARRLAGPLGEFFLFTFTAQVTTLPVILYHFGRLPLNTLLANVLVLPVQPLVMTLGGAAALTGLAWLPLGKVLAAIAWPLVAYTNRMVEWLAGMPHTVLALVVSHAEMDG